MYYIEILCGALCKSVLVKQHYLMHLSICMRLTRKLNMFTPPFQDKLGKELTTFWQVIIFYNS